MSDKSTESEVDLERTNARLNSSVVVMESLNTTDSLIYSLLFKLEITKIFIDLMREPNIMVLGDDAKSHGTKVK